MAKQKLYSEQVQETIDEIETVHGSLENIRLRISTRRFERTRLIRRYGNSRRHPQMLPKHLVDSKVLVKAEKDLLRLGIMLETAKRAEKTMKVFYRLP